MSMQTWAGDFLKCRINTTEQKCLWGEIASSRTKSLEKEGKASGEKRTLVE